MTLQWEYEVERVYLDVTNEYHCHVPYTKVVSNSLMIHSNIMVKMHVQGHSDIIKYNYMSYNSVLFLKFLILVSFMFSFVIYLVFRFFKYINESTYILPTTIFGIF